MQINFKFTFQYGQIYYPTYFKRKFKANINLHSNMVRFIINDRVDNNYIQEINLHSNMVRFIIQCYSKKSGRLRRFTFQYGQIYYTMLLKEKWQTQKIYIPIWLDLLFLLRKKKRPPKLYLHSNMVRFIIILLTTLSSLLTIIYIPIWLDLL